MKKQVDITNAAPSKRLFLSIIADYDLNKSICELIDNVLDIWLKTGGQKQVTIEIEPEESQQTISIKDNVGGLKKSELHFIIGPGQTGNLQTDQTIGIFGVGSKRAVVALSQDIKIKTRYQKDKTHLIEFDDTWLNNDSWDLPVYAIDEISEATTIIELQKLRVNIDSKILSYLKEHLQVTYAKFLLNKNIKIKLGSEWLKPINFENWAYPPHFCPRQYSGILQTADGGTVNVEVLAGLSKESSPALGEYGVYFYCNNRLIARALKTYDVGFIKGLAGHPHPSISLARVIVSLKGQAQDMPWNSSKSSINANHKVFLALQPWLVQVVKDFSSLSRRLEGAWPETVFKYPSGKIEHINIPDILNAKKSYLPPLPIARPRYADSLNQINKDIAKIKPWTKGLYESIAAVDLISKQRLSAKNRICLIILDSTLEIAFKEFLVNNDIVPRISDARLSQLFNNRIEVHKEIKKYITIDSNHWQIIEYFYNLRCKFIHERATVEIPDDQIENFRAVSENVLNKLFELNFEK